MARWWGVGAWCVGVALPAVGGPAGDLVVVHLEWRGERLAGGKANEVRVAEGTPEGLAAPADNLRETRRLNQVRRITIHCVSIGTESALLRDLAAQNGGRSVRR